MWTPSTESYSWKPIESAPREDVTLQVTDGRGKPYTLRNPSRLTAAGWVGQGNAAGGHAGSVEAILRFAASAMTEPRRFPAKS
jgi:hypothetical protein